MNARQTGQPRCIALRRQLCAWSWLREQHVPVSAPQVARGTRLDARVTRRVLARLEEVGAAVRVENGRSPLWVALDVVTA